MDSARNDLRVERIAIDKIKPSPLQVRKMDSAALGELADSLQRFGLLEPVLVRPVDGEYEMVAGHRRLAAAEKAGWSEIAASIVDVGEQEAAERLLEENVRREDLNPLERARFLRMYIDTFGVTQEEAGKRLGLKQPTVSSYLSLLSVPEPVRKLAEAGRLPISHVKALHPLAERDPDKMVKIAEEVAAKGPDDEPVPVHVVEWKVDAKLEEADRSKARRDEKQKLKDEVVPAARARLLKGCTQSDDGKTASHNATGLPVVFGSLTVRGITFWPVDKPRFKREGYDLASDAATLRKLDAVGFGLSDLQMYERRPWYAHHTLTRTRDVWNQLGESGKPEAAKCPCGSGHVVVRGFAKAPCAAGGYYEDQDPAKVTTEMHCSDAGGVTLALCRRLKETLDSEEARQQQEGQALARFVEGIGPTADGAVAALLSACLADTDDAIQTAKDAKADPQTAWRRLVGVAVDYHQRYSYMDAHVSVQELLKVVQP